MHGVASVYRKIYPHHSRVRVEQSEHTAQHQHYGEAQHIHCHSSLPHWSPSLRASSSSCSWIILPGYVLAHLKQLTYWHAYAASILILWAACVYGVGIDTLLFQNRYIRCRFSENRNGLTENRYWNKNRCCKAGYIYCGRSLHTQGLCLWYI